MQIDGILSTAVERTRLVIARAKCRRCSMLGRLDQESDVDEASMLDYVSSHQFTHFFVEHTGSDVVMKTLNLESLCQTDCIGG